MKKPKQQTQDKSQEAPTMIERTAAVAPAPATEPAPEPAAAAPAPEPVPVVTEPASAPLPEPTYQVVLTAREFAAVMLLVKEGAARNKRAAKLCGFLAEHFIERASASV